jgi:hypothetical protein
MPIGITRPEERDTNKCTTSCHVHRLKDLWLCQLRKIQWGDKGRRSGDECVAQDQRHGFCAARDVQLGQNEEAPPALISEYRPAPLGVER